MIYKAKFNLFSGSHQYNKEITISANNFDDARKKLLSRYPGALYIVIDVPDDPFLWNSGNSQHAPYTTAKISWELRIHYHKKLSGNSLMYYNHTIYSGLGTLGCHIFTAWLRLRELLKDGKVTPNPVIQVRGMTLTMGA